jgi:protein-L-isoaspartate(D-aspartate) O-methyltransferase
MRRSLLMESPANPAHVHPRGMTDMTGRSRWPALALAGVCLAAAFAAAGDDHARDRAQLLDEIAGEVRATREYLGFDALDPRVTAALAKVPRHALVPDDVKPYAYEDRPLPIGYGQTISQPYIVAIMTALLELEPAHRVLEVGTGSGYQAAVLAEIAREVYSIEIIEALGERARGDLAKLGYARVKLRVGDGYHGWPEAAPFDAIIVTAAASHVPPPLLSQLKPGGRMLVPVGSRFVTQQLVLVEKDSAGKVSTRQILPVRFVPLTGDAQD